MHPTDDTIAALSTPSGSSPRAIVRLSGPDAFTIIERLLAGPPLATAIGNRKSEIGNGLRSLPPYRALDAPLRLRPGGPLIPATLYLMRAPRSYTRQDVAEVHTIGSPPLLRMLLDAFVRLGARIAEPGEFTRRAFLAGRIRLDQAEAVLAVIQAGTAAELRAATRAVQGLASRRLHELHGRLVALRATLEASIDFAEHGIELLPEADLSLSVEDALRVVADAAGGPDAGAVPPEGIRVALCGLPNAGKSSLFNALLGHPRSIVTPIPGTTRDAVCETLAVEGIRFQLFDTAGLTPDCRLPESEICSLRSEIANQSFTDPIDTEAAVRSLGLIAGAHIALVVIDASQPLTQAERELWATASAHHKLLILTKSDLPSAISDSEATALVSLSPSSHPSRVTHQPSRIFRLSSLTGAGLPELRAGLAASVRDGLVEATPSDLILNARQRQALQAARLALERARLALDAHLGAEFIAADLRDSHDTLGAITGKTAPDDLLDRIFARFCIGK